MVDKRDQFDLPEINLDGQSAEDKQVYLDTLRIRKEVRDGYRSFLERHDVLSRIMGCPHVPDASFPKIHSQQQEISQYRREKFQTGQEILPVKTKDDLMAEEYAFYVGEKASDYLSVNNYARAGSLFENYAATNRQVDQKTRYFLDEQRGVLARRLVKQELSELEGEELLTKIMEVGAFKLLTPFDLGDLSPDALGSPEVLEAAIRVLAECMGVSARIFFIVKLYFEKVGILPNGYAENHPEIVKVVADKMAHCLDMAPEVLEDFIWQLKRVGLDTLITKIAPSLRGKIVEWFERMMIRHVDLYLEKRNEWKECGLIAGDLQNEGVLLDAFESQIAILRTKGLQFVNVMGKKWVEAKIGESFIDCFQGREYYAISTVPIQIDKDIHQKLEDEEQIYELNRCSHNQKADQKKSQFDSEMNLREADFLRKFPQFLPLLLDFEHQHTKMKFDFKL